MLRFCKEIVEAVDLLSKKKKEAYLTAWEAPFYQFEKNFAALSGSVPNFFWWSPSIRPPTAWSQELKRRAETDYHERMRSLLEDRLFFAVLQVKLADRYHNLLTSYAESSDRIEKIIESTAQHYLPIAERINERIFHLLSVEMTGLEAELVRRKTSDKVGSIA